MGFISGITGVFVGCCLNAIVLEQLVKEDPGSGTLVTFSQFVCIAAIGIVFNTKFFTVPRKVPFKGYATVVLLFFIVNVCNNYVFDFNIEMPLHMMFRSSSLISNMALGILILKKRYTFTEFVSVVMISVGILVFTLLSSQDLPKVKQSHEDSLFWWCIGVGLLTAALFLSALLGICQEVLYKKYGKQDQEVCCYTHMIPIPVFLIFLHQNLYEHFQIALQSRPYTLPIINIDIPIIILLIILNALTQYVCISSVYSLTAITSSFAVTLCITLRKFLSLFLSILYFQNPFTILHFIATAFIFTGTLLYSKIPQKFYYALYKKKEL